MTLPLNLTMRQCFAQLKTNGIAIDNLWQKAEKHGPHTPQGKQADDSLVDLLLVQQEIIDNLLDAFEVK